MQWDNGNALHGGADANDYLEKYPGRSDTVHLKERSATNDKALIGEGDIEWQRFFDLCTSVGNTEWYVIEQESYAYPPLECVDKCLQNVKAMLGR
jgi:sugar phosphate isomerase/epimerase